MEVQQPGDVAGFDPAHPAFGADTPVASACGGVDQGGVDVLDLFGDRARLATAYVRQRLLNVVISCNRVVNQGAAQRNGHPRWGRRAYRAPRQRRGRMNEEA